MVLCEKYNLDIIVKAPDGKREAKRRNAREQTVPGRWYVAIENKIKSIPTDKQLDNYAKLCDKTVEKLLLVISGEPTRLSSDWRRVNYSLVISALKQNIEQVADPYKKAIINDYIMMTDELIKIVEGQYVDMTDKFYFEPSRELNELRIADLVDKWRAAHIANMYSAKTGLVFKPGYTNKQSIIETFEEADNNITWGIQIQGRQYRRVIIADIDEDNVTDASKGFLDKARKEFRTKMLELYPGVFESRPIKGEDNIRFCSYGKKTRGKTFWYQYVIISKDATVQQIMNCISEDMKRLRQPS